MPADRVSYYGTGAEHLRISNQTFRKWIDLRDWRTVEFHNCEFVGNPSDPSSLLLSQNNGRVVIQGCRFHNFPIDALRFQYNHGEIIVEDCDIDRPFQTAYNGSHQDAIQVAPDTANLSGFIGSLFLSDIRMDYSEAQWIGENGLPNQSYCSTKGTGIDNRIPQNIHIKTVDLLRPRLGYLFMERIVGGCWNKAGVGIEGVEIIDLDLDSIHLTKLGGAEFIDPTVTVRRTPLNPGGIQDATPLDLKEADNYDPSTSLGC